MPAIRDPNKARKLIGRRHPEYLEVLQNTSWLLDTLEGGDRYRDADYGFDWRGKPLRNLIRHKREYPDIKRLKTDMFGNPLAASAQEKAEIDMEEAIEQDYETRRARTPVPNFMATFIRKQLAKIYKKKIKREGPDRLIAWTENIDGRETTLEEWMKDVIGPLVLAVGMIDVQFEHPYLPEGEPVLFGDDLSDWQERCISWYVLPENVLWWRPDWTRRYYTELLIREWTEDADGNQVETFRHWTVADWTLYDKEGKVIDESKHNYGVVPVVRLFDQRNLRTDNTATSRMWTIADISKHFYNEESELVANNTLHNCPILEGPDDDEDDESVPMGRGYMLRKVTARDGSQYGHAFLSPPTENSQFMRVRLSDLQERAEQQVALTRSVGTVSHEGKSQVAQSGVSKMFDQQDGSEYLADVSRTLEIAEYTIAYFALGILHDGFDKVPPEEIQKLTFVYPREFNLLSFDEFAAMMVAQQQYVAGGLGNLPTVEKETLKALARKMFPDATPEILKSMDKEIDERVDEAVKSRKQAARPVRTLPLKPFPNVRLRPGQNPAQALNGNMQGNRGLPAPVTNANANQNQGNQMDT